MGVGRFPSNFHHLMSVRNENKNKKTAVNAMLFIFLNESSMWSVSSHKMNLN